MVTKVLGRNILMPIGISPTAMQRMAHPEGECAAAKAAEEAGTIFILSTLSTSRWFDFFLHFTYLTKFQCILSALKK